MGPLEDEANVGALAISTAIVVRSMGSGAHDKTVKAVGVGITAFTMGPVNLTALLVTEPSVEGKTSGMGVKSPLSVGLATVHGMSVVPTHGTTRHRPKSHRGEPTVERSGKHITASNLYFLAMGHVVAAGKIEGEGLSKDEPDPAPEDDMSGEVLPEKVESVS